MIKDFPRRDDLRYTNALFILLCNILPIDSFSNFRNIRIFIAVSLAHNAAINVAECFDFVHRYSNIRRNYIRKSNNLFIFAKFRYLYRVKQKVKVIAGFLCV